jgi:hypothetical protein
VNSPRNMDNFTKVSLEFKKKNIEKNIQITSSNI